MFPWTFHWNNIEPIVVIGMLKVFALSKRHCVCTFVVDICTGSILNNSVRVHISLHCIFCVQLFINMVIVVKTGSVLLLPGVMSVLDPNTSRPAWWNLFTLCWCRQTPWMNVLKNYTAPKPVSTQLSPIIKRINSPRYCRLVSKNCITPVENWRVHELLIKPDLGFARPI